MNILGFFQRLGRALQLPIAVLPVAALLLRFGQPDLLNVAFIAQAGGAIFDNLALIFAIGVASSWSKSLPVWLVAQPITVGPILNCRTS